MTFQKRATPPFRPPNDQNRLSGRENGLPRPTRYPVPDGWFFFDEERAKEANRLVLPAAAHTARSDLFELGGPAPGPPGRVADSWCSARWLRVRFQVLMIQLVGFSSETL